MTFPVTGARPTCARRAAPALAAAWLVAVGAAAQVQQPPAPASSSSLLQPAPRSEAAEIALLLRQGKAQAALQRADAALEAKPRDAQFRFLRSIALTDLDRRGDAIAGFETLTQDFPELPEPYNNLAVIEAGQGRLDQALRHLQQAIAAQPDYVTAEENLGDLYVALAAASFERALKLAPSSTDLKSKLALTRELGAKLRAAR